MTDTSAAPAQGDAAAPAAPVPATGTEVTSGAPPQAGTSAETPDGERPSRARERIEELSAQVKAAIAYGDFMRQQLEAQTKAAAAPAPAPVQAEQPEPEPQEDAFDDPKAYAKAVAVWARKEAAREARLEATRIAKESQDATQKAIAKAREEERLKGLDTGWSERASVYAEKHPDFWTKAQNPALTFLNGDFLEAVKSSEQGPALVHAIANDPKLVAKLTSQSVPERLRTLGRIEADLSRPAPPPKVTAAPAPPSPVGNGSGGEPDPSKMSTADWMAWRNKQDPRLLNIKARR